VSRKIIKLPQDADVRSITRMNTTGFEPAKFYSKSDLEELLKPKVEEVPEEKPVRAARPEPEPEEEEVKAAPSQKKEVEEPRSRRSRRTRRRRSERDAPAEEAGEERRGRRQKKEKKHPFASLISIIHALWVDRFLHRDLCSNMMDYQEYEKNALSKVEEIKASLERITTRNEDKEQAFKEKYFIPLIDELGRFYSSTSQAAHSGQRSSIALQKDIEARLYGSFDIACRDLGWFKIQEVHPFKDKYNHFLPQQNMIGTVEVDDEMVDLVLQVHNVGLMDPQGKSFIAEANVIIGVAKGFGGG